MSQLYEVWQNPVLNVFLCESSLEQSICNTQRTKIESLSKTDLSPINIYPKILSVAYKTIGIIRVNVFISLGDSKNSDNDSSFFDSINTLELELSKRFIGGVLIDLYIFINELSPNFNRYISFLATLAELKNNYNMCYLLSPINSNGILTSSNTMLNALSAIPFIKDAFESPQKLEYNEIYFKEDAFSHEGDFFTLGYSSVKAPYDIITDITVCKLIDIYLQTMPNPATLIDLLNSHPVLMPSVSSVLFIAINIDAAVYKNITNEALLRSFFGDRLSLFYDLNCNFEQESTDFIPILSSFTDIEIYNYVNNDSEFMNLLQKNLSSAENNLHIAQEDLRQWLLLPAVTTDKKSIFTIATAYVNKKIAIANRYLELEHVQSLQRSIQALIDSISSRYELLLASYTKLREKVLENLSRADSLSTFYIKEFYEALTEKRVNDQSPFLDIKTINGIEPFYRVARSTILNNVYTQNAEEEAINRITTSGVVENPKYFFCKLVLEKILSDKNYFLHLKSQDAGKQVQITLLLDDNSFLTDYLSNERHSFKLSVVFRPGKNDIEVIYQMGAFTINDLLWRSS